MVKRKRKQPSKLKVNIIYTPDGDWNGRIHKVMQLLLRPVAQPANKTEEAPSDGSNRYEER